MKWRDQSDLESSESVAIEDLSTKHDGSIATDPRDCKSLGCGLLRRSTYLNYSN